MKATAAKSTAAKAKTAKTTAAKAKSAWTATGAAGRPRRGAGRAPGTASQFGGRVRVMVGVLAVLAIVPLWKLFGVVVSDGDTLVAQAARQSNHRVPMPATRGAIVDRFGVELAISLPRVLVAVNNAALNRLAKDDPQAPGRFVTTLAKATGAPEADLMAAIDGADPDDPYVKVIDQVTPAQAEDARTALLDEGLLDALVFEDVTTRAHPSGDSALRIIGTVGVDGPGPQAGVERYLDKALRGEPGWKYVERSPDGDVIAGSEKVVQASSPGATVRLTLDRTIQYETERALLQGAANAGAAGGVAIVGRPSTGELLAVASVDRDPGTGQLHLSERPKAFTDAYQAGSVFKLVPISAAIDDGVVDVGTTLQVPDKIQLYDREFNDHDTHPVETMSVQQILAQSSNVGTIKIAQMIGEERLYEELKAFGFGERTGIANPAESPGLLPPLEDWSGPDIAASAIGTHGSATALQLWAAYNVIANQGMYVAPRLVEEVRYPGGATKDPEPGTRRQVISADAAAQVDSALRAVITEGTAKQWNLPGFSVAAKTGTSRMPSPAPVRGADGYAWPDGTYHYLNAFTGYLPADDPQVSITVLLEDVNAGLTGSTGAGPVFSELARLGIRQLGIAPTGLGAGPGTTEAPLRAAPATATTLPPTSAAPPTTAPATTANPAAKAAPATTVPPAAGATAATASATTAVTSSSSSIPTPPDG